MMSTCTSSAYTSSNRLWFLCLSTYTAAKPPAPTTRGLAVADYATRVTHVIVNPRFLSKHASDDMDGTIHPAPPTTPVTNNPIAASKQGLGTHRIIPYGYMTILMSILCGKFHHCDPVRCLLKPCLQVLRRRRTKRQGPAGTIPSTSHLTRVDSRDEGLNVTRVTHMA